MAHGHPEPFDLDYVEIGNEDFLWKGAASYAKRFTVFYNAIHEKYPDITIISSTWDHLPENLPEGILLDYHTYSGPGALVQNFNLFDNVWRDVPYLVGEYACFTLDDGTWLAEPAQKCSVAEAIFLMGIERNSDIVKMVAYAPLLGHTNLTQWTVRTTHLAFKWETLKAALAVVDRLQQQPRWRSSFHKLLCATALLSKQGRYYSQSPL